MKSSLLHNKSALPPETFLQMIANTRCSLTGLSERVNQNRTFDVLFFIGPCQNSCEPTKVVFIDGGDLMCSAPETHLMLSS